MRTPEEKIEKLITALREAEPSADMQARVLAAANAHILARQTPLRRRWAGQWPAHHPFSAAMACAALLTMLVPFAISFLKTSDKPGKVWRDTSHAEVQNVKRPNTERNAIRTAPGEAVAHLPARQVHRRRAVPPEEASGASFSAPALPFTEQERLLLLLAQRRDPKSVAILNREQRAEEAGKRTQQFQQFFGISDQEMRSELE